MYHQSHYIDLKTFYLHEICEYHRFEFPHILSYNRFVEREQKVNMLLLIFLQTYALGKCTGRYYPIKVCKPIFLLSLYLDIN